jgi:hypothetical protein
MVEMVALALVVLAAQGKTDMAVYKKRAEMEHNYLADN